MSNTTEERAYTPWWIFAAGVLAVLTAITMLVSSASQSPLSRGPVGQSVAGHDMEVADGKLAFTVVDLRRDVAEIGDPYFGTSPVTGSYTVVSLSVRNTSAEPVTFDGSYIVGIDGSGQRLPSDRQAQYYANDDGVGLLTSIAPGGEIRTSVAFEVPAETRLTAVECHDSVFSRGAQVRLDR